MFTFFWKQTQGLQNNKTDPMASDPCDVPIFPMYLSSLIFPQLFHNFLPKRRDHELKKQRPWSILPLAMFHFFLQIFLTNFTANNILMVSWICNGSRICRQKVSRKVVVWAEIGKPLDSFTAASGCEQASSSTTTRLFHIYPPMHIAAITTNCGTSCFFGTDLFFKSCSFRRICLFKTHHNNGSRALVP